jgi:predicted transposase YbfD/YdcC
MPKTIGRSKKGKTLMTVSPSRFEFFPSNGTVSPAQLQPAFPNSCNENSFKSRKHWIMASLHIFDVTRRIDRENFFKSAYSCHVSRIHRYNFPGIQVEKDHGRIETREYYLVNNLDWLENRKDWVGLNSVGVVVFQRKSQGKTTTETRLYIASLKSDVKRFAEGARSHWGVESMHWTLDVSFQEDQGRKRMEKSPENFAIIRHFVLNLLKKEQTYKGSIKQEAVSGRAKSKLPRKSSSMRIKVRVCPARKYFPVPSVFFSGFVVI